MIIVPDKTGEVKVTLGQERPATSFTLIVPVANKYSVWTSSKNGTVRVFSEFNLHTPLTTGQQKLTQQLEPGNYFVSLAGEVGTFTVNVTTIKPVATPEPSKSPVILEAEAEAESNAKA
jgi:hypothetical protein